jgi:hypothetical protein
LTLPRWLAPVLVIALIASVVLAGRFLQPPASAPVRLDCPSLAAGCTTGLAGRTITLGVRGELRVLAPFEVWAEAAGARSVQASFTMQGMDMGFNLYTLRPGPDGRFRARVTLPVCVSGRRDWVMTLHVDDRAVQVPFTTDL